MGSLAHPPARSLLDRRQRLGFLPTLWFWDDGARQRALLPIVLPIGLLVFLLTEALSAWFPSLDVLWTALLLLHPFVVMGLVERHVRRELLLRPSDARLASPLQSAPPEPLSALVPLTIAGSAAVLLASATAGVGVALAVLMLMVLLGVFVRRHEAKRLGADRGRAGLPPPSGSRGPDPCDG